MAPAFWIFVAIMVVLVVWTAWSVLSDKGPEPGPDMDEGYKSQFSPGGPETDSQYTEGWIDLDGPLLNPNWAMEGVREALVTYMRLGQFDGASYKANKNTLIITSWGRFHIVFGEDGRIKRVEEREELPSEKKKDFYISGKVIRTLYQREAEG